LIAIVQVDASNVKNRKYFVIAVQYFKNDGGAVNKLLHFIENPDETALGMFKMLRKTITDHRLSLRNLSALSADNCNANFGQNHSLFVLMKEEIPGLLKANCHAHIIHNTVKFLVDKLDYDIENLVLKLYGHFSLSAKRREALKGFFEFNEMEYRELLHHVTTRWLTLFPCIERILNSWLSLISYFRSLPDNECPKQIKTLLYIKDNEYENTPENEIPEIYLLFCNSLLKLFQDAILILEGNKITIIDIYEVVSTLLVKLEERQTKHYFGYLVTQKLKNIDPYKFKQIENNFVAVLIASIKY
jgi:hypothetical protein